MCWNAALLAENSTSSEVDDSLRAAQTFAYRGDAPIAVALAGDVEEDEAVNRRQFTTIHYGPEAARRVCLEVCDSHFAAADECGAGCKQSC